MAVAFAMNESPCPTFPGCTEYASVSLHTGQRPWLAASWSCCAGVSVPVASMPSTVPQLDALVHALSCHTWPRHSLRRRPAARLKGLQQGKLPQTWHRSALEILADFPVPNDQHWHFVITNGLTRLAPNMETQLENHQDRGAWRKPRERKRLTRSEAWGRDRIRTRQMERVCLRPLPEIRIDKPGAATPAKRPAPESILDPFHQLQAFFPDAAGDTCPHRGYDLRTVPIEADGYRQCPLHQLRVRALAVRTPECAKHRP